MPKRWARYWAPLGPSGAKLATILRAYARSFEHEQPPIETLTVRVEDWRWIDLGGGDGAFLCLRTERFIDDTEGRHVLTEETIPGALRHLVPAIQSTSEQDKTSDEDPTAKLSKLANEQVAKLVQYYGDFETLASQAKGELLVAQTEMDVYRTLVESIVGKRANIGETLSAFLKVYRVLRAAADQVGSEAFKEYPVSNTPQPKE